MTVKGLHRHTLATASSYMLHAIPKLEADRVRRVVRAQNQFSETEPMQ